MRDLIALQDWLTTPTPDDAVLRQWFVLADAAMDNGLVHTLKRTADSWAALLEQQGSSIAEHGPHLFHFAHLLALQDSAALRHAAPGGFSILCARTGLTELSRHLHAFTMARLEGGLQMGLAFWDPAILGTLVGKDDDATLHLAGPILDSDQLQAFLRPVAAWWYWDRENRPHRIDPPPPSGASANHTASPPLRLSQAQEDQLVQASVPDQILYHLQLNQPHLFDSQLPAARRYRFVRAVLGPARELGLSGMRDLVNFTAMCLIYRQRMQTDPSIASLLDRVRLRQLTLDQAMEQMPQ